MTKIDLLNMDLHESAVIKTTGTLLTWMVTRVIGGWIYEAQGGEGHGLLFVSDEVSP